MKRLSNSETKKQTKWDIGVGRRRPRTAYGMQSYLRGFWRQKQMEVLPETIYI